MEFSQLEIDGFQSAARFHRLFNKRTRAMTKPTKSSRHIPCAVHPESQQMSKSGQHDGACLLRLSAMSTVSTSTVSTRSDNTLFDCAPTVGPRPWKNPIFGLFRGGPEFGLLGPNSPASSSRLALPFSKLGM